MSAGRWAEPYHNPRRVVPDPRKDPEGRRGGWHKPRQQPRGALVDISPASTPRSAPRQGKGHPLSAREEGARSPWEPARRAGEGTGLWLGDEVSQGLLEEEEEGKDLP